LLAVELLGILGVVFEAPRNIVNVPLCLEDGLPRVGSLLLGQGVLVLGNLVCNLVQDLENILRRSGGRRGRG